MKKLDCMLTCVIAIVYSCKCYILNLMYEWMRKLGRIKHSCLQVKLDFITEDIQEFNVVVNNLILIDYIICMHLSNVKADTLMSHVMFVSCCFH